MRINALAAVLLIPAFAAALLALIPGYRITARLNVLATFATFLSALSMLFVRPIGLSTSVRKVARPEGTSWPRERRIVSRRRSGLLRAGSWTRCP